jgi:hypothetical protein
LAAAALVVAAFLGMAALTWRGWTDPFVDYGTAVETARQLAQGRVLYRDVAALHGALAPELLAGLFRVFGAHVMTAAAAGLALAAGVTALVFALARRAAGTFAGAAAGLAFVLVFAFAQVTPANTYNWICPYVPDVTLGAALAFLALLALDRAGGPRGGARAFFAAGLATGLCFLTKAEVFAALALGTAAFFAALPRERRTGPALAAWAAGVAFPPAAIFLLYAFRGGGALGWRAVQGPWPAVLDRRIAALPFFAWVSGFDDARGNLLRLALWSLCLVGLAGFGAGAAFLAARGRVRLAGALVAASLAALAATLRSPLWLEAPRALPAASAVLLALAWRARALEVRPLRVALAAFAFGLLGKLLLHAQVAHYGFALAMPAALLTVAAISGPLPEAAGSRGADPRLARAFGAGLAALFALACAARTAAWARAKTETAGAGADLFRGDERTAALRAALREIEDLAPKDATLAVLPEGALANFLTRRSNPTPYLALMPVEEIAYTPARVAAAYRAAPPDFVLLVHKDTAEFGARAFGRDYARELGDFLAEAYEPVAHLGAEPFTSAQFGMKLLKHRASP